MKIVTLLKAVGYEIELNGDKIKYQYILQGDPPEDKVKPLLNELRKQKDDVITYLKTPVRSVRTEVSRPFWQREDGSCYACNGRESWTSIYGVEICLLCHPPAHDRLVTKWGHA